MQAIFRLALRPAIAKPLTQAPRTFTTLSPLRPSLMPLRRPATTNFAPAPTAPSGETADVVPRSAISSHPALASMQVRCGPRNTMQGHTRLVQKRRMGFLHRKRSKTGRRIMLRRRIKGRKDIAD